MFMEPRKNEVYDHINGFTPYDDDILPIFDHNSSVGNGYRFKNENLEFSFLNPPYPVPDPDLNLDPGSSSVSPNMPAQEDSHSPDEFNDCVFDFIDQILVEENVEGMQSLFYDPLELQATERSLYEALGEEYPYSQPQVTFSSNVENFEDNAVGNSGDFSTNSSTSYGNSHPHPDWSGGYNFGSNSSDAQAQSLDPAPFWSIDSTTSGMNTEMLNTHVAQNIFTDSESIKQFNRGMEEASRFLPLSKPLVIDLDQYDLPQDSKDDSPKVVVKVEKVEKDKPFNGLKGRKHYQSDDSVFEEERSSKQSALYVEEDELSEIFDRVLLGADANDNLISCCRELPSNVDHKSQQKGSTGGSNNGRAAKKQTTKAIDLSALLVNCAQAVAAGDRRSAYEQLNQVRQHASTSGDASQRLAHVFVTGIEARLAGTGSQLYAAKCASRMSAVDKLMAYQVFLSACPYKKIGMTFANKTIYDLGSTSSTIHIVDFGIAYGFQWPIFIKHLLDRPNGPPKLRITGIEYPQTGFRPAERLEETGRRLASYCKRFNVPFEYNAIASQNWETIKIEDLNLQRNEFLAVNCLARFQNLLDETVCVESPRDKVLKLIRDMKPDIFVHAVVNGAYSAPFFVTRFKETLFHYSALFDMLDATIERENEQRLNFEKEFFGRGAMNVIACEGAERVERPESYKQWQVRVSRAGFKLKPLNRELVQKLRCKRAGYHKDFVFDEDGKWILQGWKGRILYASSCWVPV